MSGLSPTTPGHRAGIDGETVRRDFPALAQEVHGHGLVYLDNAATTQKPRQVIEAIRHYYESDNANVHRGVHELSQRATDAYEGAREKARAFIGAAESAEIIFVRGATEGINLVASSWGGANVGRGDEVLITGMEHHSNIVPWQILCEKTGAKLRVASITREGEVDQDAYGRLLNDRTRIVAFTHVSNALGTVNPAKEMIERAHAEGAIALVDGAQAAPHLPVDVTELDADFYAFSSHKAYGPTGIGILYGKRALLDAMPPYQGGGDMISSVRFEKTVYNKVPHKFEAGTPNIAGVVGMGAAIDYLSGLGMDAIEEYEDDVVAYAVDMLRAIEGVNLVGTPARRAGVISFSIDGVHPHDAGTIIDREGVAIRAGHHCSQPVMDFYGVPATNRASFGIYNTRADADRLALAVRKVQEVFGA
jgi:cysteine desulfurase/selenocysteine lyase